VFRLVYKQRKVLEIRRSSTVSIICSRNRRSSAMSIIYSREKKV